MKIKAIEINNFRQFNSKVVLEFSTSDTASVTVIHGENGSGKTSLLNAFKWVLYGKTDFDTANKNILNEKAIAEADESSTISMFIKLDFDDEGNKYTALRTQQFIKGTGLHAEPCGRQILTLTYIDSSGVSHTSSNPENQLHQILPEDMHGYFFFNGERIEKLSYNSASSQVREAIRSLMGLNILERAEKQIKGQVLKQLNKEAKDSSSGDLSKLYGDQSILNENIESTLLKIEQEVQNKTQFEIEIEDINKRLLAIKDVAEKQKKREALELEIKQINVEKASILASINSLISKLGFLAFSEKSVLKVEEILEEKRAKGELPHKIKSTFIEDLLSREICICGTSVKPGTAGHDCLLAYKDSIEDHGIEQQYMNLFGSIKSLKSERVTLFDGLKKFIESRKKLDDRRTECYGIIDDLGDEILAADVSDAPQLEKRRITLNNSRDNSITNIALLKDAKLKDEEKRVEIDKKIQEELKKTNQADLAERRIELAKEVSNIISALHESMAHQVREELSSKVNQTFQSIMRKDYWAEIDDSYTLTIFKNLEGHGKQPVFEKSTGENQITSLCFISSIVNSAKERSKKQGIFYKGGIFPIVMDSPFGALDPEYRAKVAKFIPELAEQVIVMVSKSQWRGEVETELSGRLGKQYTLNYQKPDGLGSNNKFECTTVEESFNG